MYSLAIQLMKWGVQPSCMLGHSLGEYVCACLAGVFSLDDALKIVCARGKLLHTLHNSGSMLVVRLSEQDVKNYLTENILLLLWSFIIIIIATVLTGAFNGEGVSEIAKQNVEQNAKQNAEQNAEQNVKTKLPQ